jgi:hypothetical protein
MTSVPDSTPRRRPPTIDLTATEIESEHPAPEPQAEAPDGVGATDRADSTAESAADRNGGRRRGSHALGATAGAIGMAAILCALWFAGFIPPHDSATPPPAVDPKNSAAKDDSAAKNSEAIRQLAAQLDRIQAELQARPSAQALAPRFAAVEAQTKTLGDSLAAINRRLDEIAVAAQSALERADAASASVKSTAQNAVARSDLDALSGRIAALERSIASVAEKAARPAGSADDRAARAAVAAEALRAAVERGVPYQAELARAKSLGADQNAVAALAPLAAAGVPTAAELARQLSQLLASLQQASGPPSPSSGTFLGRLEDHAKNLVRITPVNAPAGEDSSSLMARLDADAAHADIAAALADIARLPPSAKTLAQGWVQKANARAAAIAASQRIAADTLAGLGNTSTQ